MEVYGYQSEVRLYGTSGCSAECPLCDGICRQLADAAHTELLQEFKGKVLPPNHPLTRHIRRVTTRILEASNLGTLEAPDVGRPKGSEELWSFNGSPEEMPPEVGGSKKWHLFVVNDDSVVNAMASYGRCIVPDSYGFQL